MIMFCCRKKTPSIYCSTRYLLYCSGIRTTVRTCCKKYTGSRKNIPGGVMVFHPRENAFRMSENPNNGHEEKSREGNASENIGNPSPRESAPFPGDRASRLRKDSFQRPPLAEFGVGARSFVDNTFWCHVGRAWRGLAARKSRSHADHTEAEIVEKSRLDMTTITTT